MFLVISSDGDYPAEDKDFEFNFIELKKYNKTEAELITAENKGIAKGEAEGIAEGKAEIAVNCLKHGMDCAEIVQITGLSAKEIERLKSQQ